jgi:hypothetical protein
VSDKPVYAKPPTSRVCQSYSVGWGPPTRTISRLPAAFAADSVRAALLPGGALHAVHACWQQVMRLPQPYGYECKCGQAACVLPTVTALQCCQVGVAQLLEGSGNDLLSKSVGPSMVQQVTPLAQSLSPLTGNRWSLWVKAVINGTAVFGGLAPAGGLHAPPRPASTTWLCPCSWCILWQYAHNVHT